MVKVTRKDKIKIRKIKRVNRVKAANPIKMVISPEARSIVQFQTI